MVGEAYDKPPIEEAICQFNFADRLQWASNIPSHLFDRVRDLYPAMPTQQQVLQANLLPAPSTDMPELSLAANERVVFADQSGLSKLSVSAEAIGIHRVRPYIGFDEDMLPRINRDLPLVLDVLEISGSFKSVSVRYINKIEIDSPNLELTEYFTHWDADNVLPAGFDGTVTAFFYRTTAQEQAQPLVLTLNFGSLVAPKDKAAFVLDIDLVYNFEEPADTSEALSQIVEIKRTENSIFESLVTDRARDLFR
jgi:uncharacterized protein (TIGR04255 family)